VWISKNIVNTSLSSYSLVTGLQELEKMLQPSSYCPGVNQYLQTTRTMQLMVQWIIHRTVSCDVANEMTACHNSLLFYWLAKAPQNQ